MPRDSRTQENYAGTYVLSRVCHVRATLISLLRRIHHVRDIRKRARVEITMRDYKSRSTRRARERLKCILYIAGARARETRRWLSREFALEITR